MSQIIVDEVRLLIERYSVLSQIEETLVLAVEKLASTFQSGGKMLVCGNGGSASDSLHITGELMKSFSHKRPIADDIVAKLEKLYPEYADYYVNTLEGALPVISLVSEVALMTAFSNDRSAELMFAQQVLGYGKKGDILLAISTSGNSANVLHAARVAKALDMTIISLTGRSGGQLAFLSDILLNVPLDITYQIQELHLPIYHTICLALERELFS